MAADDCAFNCDCGESGLCELTSDFDYGYETVLCNTTGQCCSVNKQDLDLLCNWPNFSILWCCCPDDCPAPSSCNSSYQCEEPTTDVSPSPASPTPAVLEYPAGRAPLGSDCITSCNAHFALNSELHARLANRVYTSCLHPTVWHLQESRTKHHVSRACHSMCCCTWLAEPHSA